MIFHGAWKKCGWFVARCSLSFLFAFSAIAQTTFQPVPRFPLPKSELTISQLAVSKSPFTVAGERGAVFGRQDGTFELWSFPVKILSRFRITAELSDYPIPIRMNDEASTIEVSPDHTTITYSHAAIVVKQHIFAARHNAASEAGAIVIFEIASTRPATLTFQFEPSLAPQWPAPSNGQPSASWVAVGDGGGYLLTTADPRLFGMVAMPRTSPGILPPYQEKPQEFPLELKLQFDPKRDNDLFFPLLAAVSYHSQAVTPQSESQLQQRLLKLNDSVPNLYATTRQYYSHFFDDKLTVETPEANFNRAVNWAELAIDQCQVLFHGKIGLIAGWYSSGDSARPGFGWFFGRDTLWSLYAIDSYGDFKLARNALEFLIQRQRPDGKIMHEFSQTADQVDWAGMPYFYASADSTPLFVMAMEDYLNASGDIAFVRAHWESVKKAYAFTRGHDSDGDGVYDNSEGTGWVESWPPSMPHQELYLAALDQQSAEAFSRLATWVGESGLSAASGTQSKLIRDRLNGYRQQSGFYSFSRNPDGTYDSTPTIFPAVAWWSGHLSLPDAEPMLQRWNSSEFATDWGLRSVSDQAPIYDPMAYHQGTVWPLFTGWVSMAEYRSGHPMAGFEELMSNVNLTWGQDVGAVTEVLSGTFSEPLRRSSSHQLWSSAMVLSPALRGMFGIAPDVPQKVLHVVPQLPASWDRVVLHHVPFGDQRIELKLERRGDELLVEADSRAETTFCISTGAEVCTPQASLRHSAAVRLAPVEVGLLPSIPAPGSVTTQLKVIAESHTEHSLTLQLEAPAGSSQELFLRINTAKPYKLSVSGAKLAGQKLQIQFPAGTGYQLDTVVLRY